MKYISVREAAERWKVSVRQVQHYCAGDKVPGAVYMGRQWVIPANAPRPADGRTKSGKTKQALSRYRFPIFVYTPCYSNPSELDEAEQLLLHAQKLYFEGDYTGSIAECRAVLKEDPPGWLAAGAHFTIGMNAMWLGALYEFNHSLETVGEIAEADEAHREDMLLMRTFLQFHADWDTSGVLSIDPSRLTAEAVPLYKYAFFLALLMTTPKAAKETFSLVQADIVTYSSEGITPLVFSLECLLGTNNEGSREELERHLKIAVRIAVENGWIAALNKYYPIASEALERCLACYDGAYISVIKKIQSETRRNWLIISGSRVKNKHLELYTERQIELMFFISNGYSFNEIAAVQGITRQEIMRDRRELYEITGTGSKEELTAFTRKIFVYDAAEAVPSSPELTDNIEEAEETP